MRIILTGTLVATLSFPVFARTPESVSPELARKIVRMAGMRRDALVAEICGLRTESWSEKVAKFAMTQALDIATKAAAEKRDMDAANEAMAYVQGSFHFAVDAALQDTARYKQEACRALKVGPFLALMDEAAQIQASKKP